MSRFFEVLKRASQAQDFLATGHSVEPPLAEKFDPVQAVRNDTGELESGAEKTVTDLANGAGQAPAQQLAEELLGQSPTAVDSPAVSSTSDFAAASRTDLTAPNLEDLFGDFGPEPPVSLGQPTEVTINRYAHLLPHAADPEVVDYYRNLRTKLLQLRELKPFRTLCVTSPNPNEGKTVTVLNLGMSLAMLPSFRVLVVDGDLRKGTLGKWLGVEKRAGLGNFLEGHVSAEDIVLRSEEFPVHFIVRGTSSVAPAELLHNSKWKTLMRRMAEYYDVVLVDCPPANLVSDTHLLAAGCDGVLLVARAFSTTCKQFQKMAADLAQFRILGTVLNAASTSLMYYGYGGYGRYGLNKLKKTREKLA